VPRPWRDIPVTSPIAAWRRFRQTLHQIFHSWRIRNDSDELDARAPPGPAQLYVVRKRVIGNRRPAPHYARHRLLFTSLRLSRGPIITRVCCCAPQIADFYNELRITDAVSALCPGASTVFSDQHVSILANGHPYRYLSTTRDQHRPRKNLNWMQCADQGAEVPAVRRRLEQRLSRLSSQAASTTAIARHRELLTLGRPQLPHG